MKDMNVYKPEIVELLHLVEEKFGKPLDSTNDFEEFALRLKGCRQDVLSVSTLKRIWGYVNDSHRPRTGTLDALSRYLGHPHFQGFCLWLKKSPAYNSSFFSAHSLDVASQLCAGDEVEIGWAPNRYLRLAYRGGSVFEVKEAKASKLQAGDSFEAAGFVLGQPLLLAYVMRGGERTSPFIAGRNGGLTILNCLHHAHR